MNRLPEVRDQARNRWPSLLAMLGLPVECLRNRHGPCPICGGKDRFRFDDKEGRGTYICTCGSGDGMALAMAFTGMSFPECAAAIRDRLGASVAGTPQKERHPDCERRALAELWQGAAPIWNDEAAQYLASRQLPGPYSTELRFHSAARVSDHPSLSVLPAMLARVSDHNGRGVALHRTYLQGGLKARWTPKGQTTEAGCRRLLGTLSAEAAIRLAPHDGLLAVAEGIETALAVTRDTGLPCWSLINATHMAKWPVPANVTELHVFGDNDPLFAGQAAAWQLAHRAAVSRERPKVLMPSIPNLVGSDWADVSSLSEAA